MSGSVKRDVYLVVPQQIDILGYALYLPISFVRTRRCRYLTSESGTRLYHFDEESVTQEPRKSIPSQLNQVQAKYRKWARISTEAFLASCSLVKPFLTGNPLHRYSDALGNFFLFLTQILLLPFAISLGRIINALFFTQEK